MQPFEDHETAPSLRRSYRDGSYRARGWYGSAGAFQDVIMVIEAEVIIAVGVTTPAEDEASLGYQQRFARALPAAIGGARLDEVRVDRLAGSSGCSDGFMRALDKIRQSAREV